MRLHIEPLLFINFEVTPSVLFLKFPAYLVGGFANAPSTGWRPDQLEACVNPNGLILSDEPSPNENGFLDGIIATPPGDSTLIIGRVKLTTSKWLAPLMRSKRVVVEAHFDWKLFNFKAWRMRIDVFCNEADCAEIQRYFSEYVVLVFQSYFTPWSR